MLHYPSSSRSRRAAVGSFGVARCLLLATALTVVPIGVVSAQETTASAGVEAGLGTGTVLGRVQSGRTGAFLERARVQVAGTSIETFTDADGYYRLGRMSAGPVTLRVSFTGLGMVTATVNVVGGSVVQRDVVLAGQEDAADDVVLLDAFVVEAQRELDGAAIAINEQRFSSTMLNVVAADEFGPIADGSVGELLKNLPGIEVQRTGGNARDISINGVPPSMVPVTVNGFSLASAGVETGNTTRNVAMDLINVNNLARIEVSYAPTPESPGSALAGTVNMVTRSSFERARPELRASLFILGREGSFDFSKQAGPGIREKRLVNPGFDFSYVVPVSSRFGFTVSASAMKSYNPQPFYNHNWRGVSPFPGTFAPTTPDQPYLVNFTLRALPAQILRTSLGFTTDFRISETDRLSFSLMHTYYDSFAQWKELAFGTGPINPGNFTATSTQGSQGRGQITYSGLGLDRVNSTILPSISWRHDGSYWKFESGLGWSAAKNENRSISKGFFGSISATRPQVNIRYDDATFRGPGRVTVTDNVGGAQLDPWSASNRVVRNAGGVEGRTDDEKVSFYGSARRDFYGRWPVSLKAGFDLRGSRREISAANYSYQFVGADGVPGGPRPTPGDDGAAQFVDPLLSAVESPFGFPTFEGIGVRTLFEHFESNPEQFILNQTMLYQSQVNNSKLARELISAGYVRGDLTLLDGKLKLVGGLRGEQTNVVAYGPRNDPTANFQRDANGNVIRLPNGNPALIHPAGSLAALQLTLTERGTRAEKEYLRWFPSINASYEIIPNLYLRTAYYYSVGRPGFNQYAGGVTLPNIENPPGPGNRISVNNAGIKAWESHSTLARLEYYLRGVGQVSIQGFRRNYTDLFGGSVTPATPEFLALYGLDPNIYGQYEVTTQVNVPGTTRIEGYTLNYRQALTFLPEWARGVQVFGNFTRQRLEGENRDLLFGAAPRPRTGNYGISLARERFNIRLSANYASTRVIGRVTGDGVPPDTFNISPSRTSYDLNVEYYLRKDIALFGSWRDLGDTNIYGLRYNDQTPEAARLSQRFDFGTLVTLGVRGRF
jgi:iron complex outermembrane receptor protein